MSPYQESVMNVVVLIVGGIAIPAVLFYRRGNLDSLTADLCRVAGAFLLCAVAGVVFYAIN